MFRAMLERALVANAPFSSAAADSVYDVGDIEMVLRRVGKEWYLHRPPVGVPIIDPPRWGAVTWPGFPEEWLETSGSSLIE